MSGVNLFQDPNEAIPPSERLLDAIEPQGHIVQFYKADDELLSNNVSQYLWQGLKWGDGLLVVATPKRRETLIRKLRKLGADPAAAVRDGNLVLLDAEEMLARFMIDGQPDWDRFESTIGAAVRELQGRPDHADLRAYGEMVGILWKRGEFSAGIRLEQFWNTLLESYAFKLFCGYPIDVFGKEFQISAMDSILCAHTHLLTAGTNQDLEGAIIRAMNETLGSQAEGLRLLIKANYRPSWAEMPKAEATILWLRNNLPGDADQILARARNYYQQAQKPRRHAPRNQGTRNSHG